MMKRVWSLVGMQTDTFTMDNFWKFIKELGIKPLLLFFSCCVMSRSLQPNGLQHTRLLCPLLSPGVCSNSCPLSRWCYLTISSSAIPFFSCLQSFPVSGSLPMNWLFASGVQSIGASASVLPMNIQGWFPLGLTGLISLQSKGLSRVFSNTTVQKHQFFFRPSLWSNFISMAYKIPKFQYSPPFLHSTIDFQQVSVEGLQSALRLLWQARTMQHMV